MSPLYARQHPPFCHLCHDRGLPLHNHSRCHQGLLLLPLCHLQHYSRCHQGLPVLPLCHPHHYSRYYKGLPNFNPHHHHKACISLSCMCQTNQCTLLLIKAPQMIQIVQNHGPQMYFITFHLCHYPPHNCHHQQHQHSHLQGSSTTNNYIIYPRGHHGGHPSATPRNPLRLKARAGDRAGGGAGAGAGAGARASPGTSNASPVDHGDQSQTPPVLACLN